MTIWVGQGQSHLPADVPGSLRHPADEASFNRRAGCISIRLASSSPEVQAGEDNKNPPTGALPKAARPRQDRQRMETSVTPATLVLHQPQRASPSTTKGSEANRKHMPRICWSKGKRHFIKWLVSRQRARGRRGPRQDRNHGGAGSRAAGHQTVTRPPPI
jgi:hypothetical protein